MKHSTGSSRAVMIGNMRWSTLQDRWLAICDGLVRSAILNLWWSDHGSHFLFLEKQSSVRDKLNKPRSPPCDSGTAPMKIHDQQFLLSLPQLLLLLSIFLLPSTAGAGSWRWAGMAAMLEDGSGWACCGRQEKRDWQEGGEVEEAEQEKKVKKEEMVVVRVAPVRWRHSPGVKHTHTGERKKKSQEGGREIM